MAVITKIQTQTKNTERCNLYLNGEFYCGISLFTVMQNRLKEGMEIDESQLADLVFESDKEKAFNYAVDYICKYLSTEKQLTHKLYDKGYNKRLVDFVICKCKEYGYIDDFKYAQNYIYLNSKIKGKQRLQQELMLKGISKSIIEVALEDYKEDESGCLSLAKKKIINKDLDDPKVYASLVRYLQSRGYEWDSIKKSLDTIKREEENSND